MSIVISKEGSLSKYGYKASKTVHARKIALVKAVKANGYLKVMRRVNAIYVLNKNRPTIYQGF
jgi:hypothetical protein